MSFNLANGVNGDGICLSAGGWDEGTNAQTIKSTYAISYSIKGRGYYKAATDNIAMTALSVQAANTSCLYLVQINSSGTVSIKKGSEVANTNVGQQLLWPLPDAGNVAVAGFKVKNAGSTFTSGTTDLGSLETWYDFTPWPTEPVVVS